MPQRPVANRPARIRIGAVAYLNAQPLTAYLAQFAPNAEIVVDLPSRLADSLAANNELVRRMYSLQKFAYAINAMQQSLYKVAYTNKNYKFY